MDADDLLDTLWSFIAPIVVVVIVIGGYSAYSHFYMGSSEQAADEWVEDSNRLIAYKIADAVTSKIPFGVLARNHIGDIIKNEFDENIEWIRCTNDGGIDLGGPWRGYYYGYTFNISVMEESHKVRIGIRVDVVARHLFAKREVHEVDLVSVRIDDGKDLLKDDINIYCSEWWARNKYR